MKKEIEGVEVEVDPGYFASMEFTLALARMSNPRLTNMDRLVALGELTDGMLGDGVTQVLADLEAKLGHKPSPEEMGGWMGKLLESVSPKK